MSEPRENPAPEAGDALSTAAVDKLVEKAVENRD